MVHPDRVLPEHDFLVDAGMERGRFLRMEKNMKWKVTIF